MPRKELDARRPLLREEILWKLRSLDADMQLLLSVWAASESGDSWHDMQAIGSEVQKLQGTLQRVHAYRKVREEDVVPAEVVDYERGNGN